MFSKGKLRLMIDRPKLLSSMEGCHFGLAIHMARVLCFPVFWHEHYRCWQICRAFNSEEVRNSDFVKMIGKESNTFITLFFVWCLHLEHLSARLFWRRSSWSRTERRDVPMQHGCGRSLDDFSDRDQCWSPVWWNHRVPPFTHVSFQPFPSHFL